MVAFFASPDRFKDVPLHIVESVGIGCKLSNRMSGLAGVHHSPRILCVLCFIIAPLEGFFIKPATRSIFPFGICRKPIAIIRPVGENPRLARFFVDVSGSFLLMFHVHFDATEFHSLFILCHSGIIGVVHGVESFHGRERVAPHHHIVPRNGGHRLGRNMLKIPPTHTAHAAVSIEFVSVVNPPEIDFQPFFVGDFISAHLKSVDLKLVPFGALFLIEGFFLCGRRNARHL